MGKITLLTGLILGFITGTAIGQPTKPELTDYLKTTYQEQLNITALPDSFFDCGYRVFNYNYTKSENAPQKDIGDECLYPLLEDDLDSVDFSDRGRKLYQAMKPQFIQSCASLTESTIVECTCAHNYYDSKGLGYVDVANPDFPNSDIKKEAQEKCIPESDTPHPEEPTTSESESSMADKWVSEYLDKNTNQTKAEAIFKRTLDSVLVDQFNITKIPDQVYDCGYSMYTQADDFSFDIGYEIGRECLLNRVDEIEFSDDGLKFLKESENPFVNGCTTANKEYEESINVGRFCQCLHQEYVKYEIGFKTIMDPEFLNTTFSEKMATYCFSIHKKES